MDALATSVRSHLATDFERKVFDASLQNFADATNPLRTSNFAYSIRELSRHILKRLAPDDHITKCQWYVAQYNKQGKEVITRAQRVQFAVHGGLSEGFVVDTLDVELDEMRKQFLGVINDLNKFTHIEEVVFLIDDVAAAEIATATLVAFSEFFFNKPRLPFTGDLISGAARRSSNLCGIR